MPVLNVHRSNIGPAISTSQAVGGWRIGPTGEPGTHSFDLVAQQNTTEGLTGPIFSLINNPGATGPTGPQGIVGNSGSTGPTGPTGTAGQAGVAGGIVFFLSTANATYNGSPITGALTQSDTGLSNTTNTISSVPNSYSTIATFTLLSNILQTPVIPAGLWDLNLFGAIQQNKQGNTPLYTNVYFNLYSVDGSNENLLVDGTSGAQQINELTKQEIDCTIYMPTTILSSISTALRIKLLVEEVGNVGAMTLYFQGTTPSHIHTSLTTPGVTGPTGPANTLVQQFVRSTIAVNNTLNISNILSNMVWIINPATAGTANVTLHPGGPTGTYHYINNIG